jgi:hypothetical protein
VVGVEVYGLRVKDLSEGMRMNPGSATRRLARASKRERKDGTFHEHRLALAERLGNRDANGPRSRKGEMVIPGTQSVLTAVTGGVLSGRK